MDAYRGPNRDLRRAVKEVLKDYACGAAVGIAILWILPGWIRCCFVFALALVFLSSVIAPFIICWKPKGKIDPEGKAVVISGCDSGFGHSLAQRLDDVGYQVFAGCLFPDGEGAAKLRKSCSSRLHVVELDVTKDTSVQNLQNYVNDNLKENVLWAVVCNAGLNDGGQVIWTSFETIKKVIDVNTFGVVRVAKAFLPQLCKNKGGRVVAVASAAGRASAANIAAYCMSKHAVIAFCDSLRLEMNPFGVQVTSIEPWFYRTPITNEDRVKAYVKSSWDSAPDDVKELFSQNYLDEYFKASKKFVNYSISNNPSEVVSCMEEAITAKYPEYSYMPGSVFSKTTYWFTRKLPQPLHDFLYFKAFRSMK